MLGQFPPIDRLAAENLKDQNATQAAIRAGYSVATARVQGPRLLSKVAIQQKLAAAFGAREVEARVDSERLEREAERISISDIRRLFRNGQFLPIDELPDDIAGAVASIETVIRKGENGPEQIRKIRFWDKNTAQRRLFQLRGDGKVNDQNLNVKGDLALHAAAKDAQLAMKHLTPDEFQRVADLALELNALVAQGLGRARAADRS